MEEMQDSVATCCFDMFENRNKIVPSVILQNSGDFDFVEINPQRRIRVIHLKPYQSFGENIVKEGEDNEEDNEEDKFRLLTLYRIIKNETRTRKLFIIS